MTGSHPKRRGQAVRAPLRLRGVSKRFGVVQALSEVDLDIRAGEVLALVGENGAGKSTMMRIVEGVVAPDSGTLFVDGLEPPLREPDGGARAPASASSTRNRTSPPTSPSPRTCSSATSSRVGGVFLDRRDLARRTRASSPASASRRCCRPGPAPGSRRRAEAARRDHARASGPASASSPSTSRPPR